MQFKKYIPSSELSHFIAYYWTLKSSENDLQGTVYRFVPDGFVDWIFHIGTPWYSRFANSNADSLTKQCHVFGQINKYVDLRLLDKNLNLFGIKFHPWAVKSIWNLDMHYVTDSTLGLEDLELYKIKELQEKILMASTIHKRIEAAELYFKSYYSNSKCKYLRPLLGFTKEGDITLKPILSKRRLEQRFRLEIGISQRRFFKILKVNQIIEQIINKGGKSFTHIALDNGYFDQSHFNRDFKQFTGFSPNRFLNSINPEGDIFNLKVS